jgi:hypothetical protein
MARSHIRLDQVILKRVHGPDDLWNFVFRRAIRAITSSLLNLNNAGRRGAGESPM